MSMESIMGPGSTASRSRQGANDAPTHGRYMCWLGWDPIATLAATCGHAVCRHYAVFNLRAGACGLLYCNLGQVLCFHRVVSALVQSALWLYSHQHRGKQYSAPSHFLCAVEGCAALVGGIGCKCVGGVPRSLSLCWSHCRTCIRLCPWDWPARCLTTNCVANVLA